MSPPYRTRADGSSEIRYHCEYRTWSGEMKTVGLTGFRTTKYRSAIAKYHASGGHFDDLLPGGYGHLHDSMSRGGTTGLMWSGSLAIMSAGGPGSGAQVGGNGPQYRKKSTPTTMTLAILESLGYAVDMSLALPNYIIGGPRGEHEVCAPYAAMDGDYDPMGGVNVYTDAFGTERSTPTRLVRNW